MEDKEYTVDGLLKTENFNVFALDSFLKSWIAMKKLQPDHPGLNGKLHGVSIRIDFSLDEKNTSS